MADLRGVPGYLELFLSMLAQAVTDCQLHAPECRADCLRQTCAHDIRSARWLLFAPGILERVCDQWNLNLEVEALRGHVRRRLARAQTRSLAIASRKPKPVNASPTLVSPSACSGDSHPTA